MMSLMKSTFRTERKSGSRTCEIFYSRRNPCGKCPAAVINYVKGTLAIAHNGNLVNAIELRKELEYTGAIFQTTIDSEVIAYHIARERLEAATAEEAVRLAMKKIKGAYALVVSSPRKMIGARDPFGLKPLCIEEKEKIHTSWHQKAVQSLQWMQSLCGMCFRERSGTDRYVSPLSERYASKEMQYIFSPDMKFRTWRKLWIALAETEKELGLSITDEQIEELKANAENINYDVAKEREKVCRHDVMSHVYAYGVQCPKAKGIIHLGATSCYVGDNTDIIVMNEALKLVKKKLVNVIAELAKFADTYKDQPTLAFTHFQPAQPTTVGKRATLWMQEFLMDLEDLEYVQSTLKLLGSKGTTGTQASFLELFEGDQETIDKIDPMIAEKMGFKNCYPVSGQTYSRKVDTRVLNVLAGIAASAHEILQRYPSSAAS